MSDKETREQREYKRKLYGILADKADELSRIADTKRVSDSFGSDDIQGIVDNTIEAMAIVNTLISMKPRKSGVSPLLDMEHKVAMRTQDYRQNL